MSTSVLDEKKRQDSRGLRRVGAPKSASSKEGEGKPPFRLSSTDNITKFSPAAETSNVAQSPRASKQQKKELDAKSKIVEETTLQYSASSSIAERRQKWKEGQLDVESSSGPPDKEKASNIPGAFRAGGDKHDDQSSLFLDHDGESYSGPLDNEAGAFSSGGEKYDKPSALHTDGNSEYITTEGMDYLVTATVVEEEPEREIVPAVLIEQHQQDAEHQLSSALDELETVRQKEAARRRLTKIVLIAVAFCLVVITVIAVVVALITSGDRDSDQTRQNSIKLMLSEEPSNDDFGCNVAIDANGTIVAIAAMYDNNNTGTVYIFSSWKEDGSPMWRKDAKVTPSDAIASDFFGSSVAFSMDGDTLVVGADQYDNEGGGYVSIFTRNENNWNEHAKLLAKNFTDEELFGTSVALSQDTIVVGAKILNESSSGSVYVFTQSDGVWNQNSRLSPGDAIEASCDGSFGVSVATSLDGNVIVVGADRCGSGDMSHGNAYVFEKTSDGSWRQEAKLVPADIQPEDGFGFSVDISKDGTTIVAGSPGDRDVDNLASGSVYIFKKIDGKWNEHAKLTSDKRVAAMMGQSVKIDGDARTIVAGALGQRWGSGFVFTLTDDGWTEKTELIGPDNDIPTDFGFPIALSRDGKTAIFGAPPSDGTGVAGSAYIFQL